MKRIYISAPISGCEDTAKQRFADAVRLAKRLLTFVDAQGKMYKVLRYAWEKPRNAF